MGRLKIKWKPVFLLHLLLLNVLIKSLPISKTLPTLTTVDTSFPKLEIPEYLVADIDTNNEFVPVEVTSDIKTSHNVIGNHTTESTAVADSNVTRTLLRNIRPGQEVRQYDVHITYDGGMFHGRVVIDVRVETATRDDPLVFHIEDLDVSSVMVGIFTDANAQPTDYNVDNGILEIFPEPTGTTYVVIVEYSGQIRDSYGPIVESNFMDSTYITMNLYPTNARRLFPCVDEPTQPSTVKFTFNNMPYASIVSNSMPEEGSFNEFRALQGPAHLWGMVAHNFVNMINIVIASGNILLYGRSGRNQESQASIAISNYYTALDAWTNKPYFETVVNQDGRMLIFSLPDTNRDWNALSTVTIWEPHIFMQTEASVKQRKTALATIAEAMARQWFGYIIHAENWRDQWVIQGLASYAAYEVFKGFQPFDGDQNLIDVNTLFVTDVIQESLLRDGRVAALPLHTEEDILDEPVIRDHINGLLKLKSPVIMRMLRLVLGGEDNDFVQSAGRVLLNNRALQTVGSHNFFDAINSEWLFSDNRIIDDVAEFIEPWIMNQGYPIVIVSLRQGGLLLTQEHFSYSSSKQVNYQIPITYTTNLSPNFETENVHSVTIMDANHIINVLIGEEDFVLFNIQGQGYYRVNYDGELWFRIIEALNDPERRQQIHPLNRATLVDDALNLARAGKLQYDIAFQVVLSMEHEMEYAVWKAFVRNMDFIRKRLVALVTIDEERDPDIYLRMVRRTIGTVEAELGFYPDPQINEPPMHSLTRGLVMDHACRSNYAPCIAAAVDWFYDRNSDVPTVNPDIPTEIRPAVYCTMVREGDGDVIAALYARLEIEESLYERVVILESLACSLDEGFINTLLLETLAGNSPYGTEERVKIFTAVAESSFDNARIALNFISMRTQEIRERYGGPEKLEEIIYMLVDNMVLDLFFDFQHWVNNIDSNLDDSTDLARKARDMVSEDVIWEDNHMEAVYEWIDENNAPTLVTSLVLLSFSLVLTLFY